jgi:2',3'-cyclic-nucleotide 2'-phosphodiesterase (5'-nucleotidase family)
MADEFQSLSSDSRGALIIEAMNQMAYDATVLGERDLQLGVDDLRQRMEEAEFAVLSANVRLAETGELLAEPYTILELGGWNYGIVGLTGPDPNAPSAFSIADPFSAIEEILPTLSAQTDWVVVLSHLGWTQNTRLADLSPEIDLIVGGGLDKPDSKPHHSRTTGTYVAQAERPSTAHAGRQIGHWSLTLNAGAQIEMDDWTSVRLGPEIADDPALLDLVERYRDLFPTN